MTNKLPSVKAIQGYVEYIRPYYIIALSVVIIFHTSNADPK